MKKTVFMFLLVSCICSLAIQGICGQVSLDDAEAEKIYLQERSLRTNPSSNLNENEIKDFDRSKRTLSTNSDDLTPLKGSTWIMSYKIGSTVYADVLTFGTQINKTSDGTVSLRVNNNILGYAFYGDGSFSATIDGSVLTDFYSFKINGNAAQGTYMFVDSKNNVSDQYPMTGMKFGSDIGSNNAVSIGNTLDLSVPLAVYNGSKYGFVLNYVSIPTDPTGYYWKLDLNTFTAK